MGHLRTTLAALGVIALSLPACGQSQEPADAAMRSDAGHAPCTTSRTCPGQVCDVGRGYCVDCVTSTDCSGGNVCRASECVAPPPPCTSDRDCSALALVCDQVAHMCVECAHAADCQTDQYCAAGTCAARLCADGDTTCASSTMIATCLADGSGFGAATPCGGSLECIGRACVPGDAGMDAATNDAGNDAGDDAAVAPADAFGIDAFNDAGSGPLYHGWTAPADCDATHYNMLAPSALGGFYPYLAGDTPRCRMWKLAATVCTTPPSEYGTGASAMDWSCPHSGGFTDPTFGTFCGSPASPQFACADCYGSCNAGGSCPHRPYSLRDCLGGEADEM